MRKKKPRNRKREIMLCGHAWTFVIGIEDVVAPMTPGDRFEVAELIYASINVWYRNHGMAAIFHGGPRVTEVFYDVYNDLNPGCNVVAVDVETGG